jgi:glutamate-1-semialdehyde 2,1-aminomutase
MRNLSKSQALWQTAKDRLPQGVASNYRYWGPDETLYVERAKGAHLFDVDGNRYIDYRLGYGPIILGHADERVDDAVIAAVRDGVIYAMSHPLEQQVAARIIEMVPSVELVRFSPSGTEATHHALRLARGYTRREKFIIFEGNYNGLHDHVMFQADLDSPRERPIPQPRSLGIPEALRELVIMLPFNDQEALERTVRARGHELAAIIVEPILGNCGGIPAEKEFLHLIRRLCDEHGIVMFMDEVKTGFRVARGGAQELYGVTADLTTFAKAMGNGYPVAAFGGKREIMELLGNGVSHGGTYNGNRVALAAADAVLGILQHTDALDHVAERGRQLQEAISEALQPSGLPFVFSGHPSMFIFWFAEQAPREYRDWKGSDHALYDRVAAGLIERGVMPEPDSREPWFVCEALSEQDIADTATALEDSLAEALGRPVRSIHVNTGV